MSHICFPNTSLPWHLADNHWDGREKNSWKLIIPIFLLHLYLGQNWPTRAAAPLTLKIGRQTVEMSCRTIISLPLDTLPTRRIVPFHAYFAVFLSTIVVVKFLRRRILISTSPNSHKKWKIPLPRNLAWVETDISFFQPSFTENVASLGECTFVRLPRGFGPCVIWGLGVGTP